ncbi:MAG: NAD(P)H-dependent oxidoreductase [Selenomonadaceae bacterium]|nr:NAD(P)H-dependent oxidoreductase [Selenomonadaceae bacterium]
MKKLLLMFLSAFMLLTFTACGSEAVNTTAKADSGKEAPAKQAAPQSTETAAKSGKILVAYFSCTGNTKALAQTAADILQADIYEIRPEVPYSSNDLNYNDETTRATVEQKDDSARPALADKNANISAYDTIVLAYPIWWGQAPRIVDTFVESYDFDRKTIIPICTSGGSDIGSSADYLKGLMKGAANWKEGKRFGVAAKDEVMAYLNSLGI